MKPEIDRTAFISDKAVIIGNVKISKNCGIFPNSVIRGDQNSIEIGENSNIQDCCVVHCDSKHNVKIGKNVSIGHCAMVHGATIEDDCLIGIHATVLNGSVIKKGSIIGANALVKENMVVPENSLVVGIPGKVIKQDESFRIKAKNNAETYVNLSRKHLNDEFEYYKK